MTTKISSKEPIAVRSMHGLAPVRGLWGGAWQCARLISRPGTHILMTAYDGGLLCCCGERAVRVPHARDQGANVIELSDAPEAPHPSPDAPEARSLQ